MIYYGVCSGPTDKYERWCLPGLRTAGALPSQVVVLTDQTSIFEAYNELLDRFAEADDLDGVVLLHDDVTIHEDMLEARLRRRFREGVGIVGPVGGRGLHNMRWWEANHTFGGTYDPNGFRDFGVRRHDAETVDGFLLGLSPDVVRTVRFDDERYSGFHGYDADFCFTAGERGFRIAVEPMGLFHHSPGAFSPEYYAAEQIFMDKWAHRLVRQSLTRKHPYLHRTVREAQKIGWAGRPLLDLVSRDVGGAARKATARLTGHRPPAGGGVAPTVEPGRGPSTETELSRRATPASGVDSTRVSPADRAADGDVDVEGTVVQSGVVEGGAVVDADIEGGVVESEGPDGVVAVACPVCGADAGGRYIAVSTSRGVRVCDGCGTGVTSPPPEDRSRGADLFEHGYDGARLDRRDQWFTEAENRLTWVEDHVPDGVLLEVGAATGELVMAAHRRGFDAYGIEPSTWAVEQARELGADVMPGVLADWQREYDGFRVDAACLFHVVEHLPDPALELGRLADMVRPGGMLFVEVPNFACAAAQAGDVDWAHWSIDFHHWHFTPDGLSRLLDAAGFEPLEVGPKSWKGYTDLRHWEALVARSRADGRPTVDSELLRARARRR